MPLLLLLAPVVSRVPLTALQPDGAASALNTAFPLMLFLGGNKHRSRRRGSPSYDPYQCAGHCAGQQGYCPPLPEANSTPRDEPSSEDRAAAATAVPPPESASALLQLQERAPVPPRRSWAAGRPALPAEPFTPTNPARPGDMNMMGMAYPMLMMMGQRKHRSNAHVGDLSFLHQCINICRGQQGCGDLPNPSAEAPDEGPGDAGAH